MSAGFDEVLLSGSRLTAVKMLSKPKGKRLAIPEPTTLALFGLGAAVVVGWRRRGRRKSVTPAG